MPLFHLYLWRDRLLLLGPGFDTGFHRHHAAQLCLGLDAALRLRQAPDQPWQEAAGFFVPPDQPHQFEAGGAVAILYLDAQSQACAACLRHYGATAPAPLDAITAASLAALLQLRQNAEPADPTAALQAFGTDCASSGNSPLDPRVSRALQWIDARLDQSPRLRDMAEAAGLSESQLAHLFSAQVGVPPRRYILWRRLRRALELALRGDSLTVAAHAAGFSDSAHLSRTFRDNFGVTPSFLFEHRAAIAVTLVEQPV